MSCSKAHLIYIQHRFLTIANVSLNTINGDCGDRKLTRVKNGSLPVGRNISAETAEMHPDMFPLVERLVVAVERISQDVNNISAYVYDLSYSMSHLIVEKRENEDISSVPHAEDDSCLPDPPVTEQEASSEREYFLQYEQAGDSPVSHTDDLELDTTCVGDTVSMTIDDNEDCVVLSSSTEAVKTEEKSEREINVSCDVHNTYVDQSMNMREIAAVVKEEINFSEDLLSEARNSFSPVETLQHEDCSTGMDRHRGSVSSESVSHLMAPKRVYSKERPISQRDFNATSQVPSVGKPFVCRECGKKFIDRYHLIRHIRVHTREKPYKCSVCEYASSRRDALTNHMRIHTREKPYKCSVCEYASSRSDALTSHMRIHTREKPYRCSVCGNAYAQSGGLKAHMGVHTGDCPFACENCGSRFNSSAGLLWHIRFMHSVPSGAPSDRE